MNRFPAQQKGASAIVNIIMLAILCFGVYVGIQYVPQLIESKAIDSILQTMDSTQKTTPVNSAGTAKERLVGLLQINEMNDMTDSYTVKERNGRITIAFNYDRELNLIFKKQPMHYKKRLILN
ncbi:MAG: DUF4845 domain-containing protein [Xanthomonadales bacterium]|nr:DUF4845 domain-containing protein [Xanthomonadales bacterium]